MGSTEPDPYEPIRTTSSMVFPLFGSYYIGKLFEKSADTWYDKLTFPWYRWPNSCFPVFNFFQIFAGLASYYVWKDGGGFYGKAIIPLIIYATQLILHYVTLIQFFEMKNLKVVSN